MVYVIYVKSHIFVLNALNRENIIKMKIISFSTFKIQPIQTGHRVKCQKEPKTDMHTTSIVGWRNITPTSLLHFAIMLLFCLWKSTTQMSEECQEHRFGTPCVPVAIYVVFTTAVLLIAVVYHLAKHCTLNTKFQPRKNDRHLNKHYKLNFLDSLYSFFGATHIHFYREFQKIT